MGKSMVSGVDFPNKTNPLGRPFGVKHDRYGIRMVSEWYPNVIRQTQMS
jgi:hypothetical protein